MFNDTARRENNTMGIVRAFYAEQVKYRKSMTFWLAFGVPALFISLAALVAAANYATIHFLGHPGMMSNPGESGWQEIVRLYDNPWQMMVVPFGLAILGTLATHMMHSTRMWPVTAVQPISRTAMYLAQLGGLMLVVLGGMLTVGLGYLVIGILFGYGPVDWSVVLGRPLLSWGASFGALAVQVWLGTRFRGFALPIVFGTAGAMGSMILRAFGAWFLGPWGYPLMVHETPMKTLAASLVIGVVFSLIGLLDFNRQELA